jgi:hypothetical protein
MRLGPDKTGEDACPTTQDQQSAIEWDRPPGLSGPFSASC